METTVEIDDAVLHEVDEPLHVELVQSLARYDLPTGPNDDDPVAVSPAALTERSPLLLAGTSPVLVDPKVDLRVLAATLAAEEQAEILADKRVSAWSVIQEETWRLIALAIPLVLVAMTDAVPDTVLNMMIGRSSGAASTRVLAAFSLANLFHRQLVVGVLNGLASATDTVCSQAFGGRRGREYWIYAQAGGLAFACSLPILAVLVLNGPWILKCLGQRPETADTSMAFFAINALCMPFMMLYALLKSVFQAQNQVTPCLRASIGGWLVALPVAYLLGFQTSLGYVGVFLAVLVSNGLKSLALLPVLVSNEVVVRSWPGWKWREARALLPRICQLGVSGFFMVVFQMLGVSAMTVLAGWLPRADVMVAANGMVNSVIVLTFMPLMGICIAGAIRLGNALGAGRPHRTLLLGRIILATSTGVGVTCMLVAMAIGDRYIGGFTRSPEAINEALGLIHAILPGLPLMGVMFGFQSIFRGCGRQWLCAVLNLVLNCGLGTLVGVVLGFYMEMGVRGLWFGHLLGMFAFCAGSAVWLWRLDWAKMAHEARQRTHLHVEGPHGVAPAANAA